MPIHMLSKRTYGSIGTRSISSDLANTDPLYLARAPMKLQDGDCPYGRFISPSGREIKSFSEVYTLPPESELKVRFLGSLSSVAEVFANFDGEKMKILKSIHFGGLSRLAEYQTFDLYFYLWVMTKLDTSTCSIRVRGSEEIPIRDEDVGRILGIPWYGVEMVVDQYASYDTMSRIRNLLSVEEDKPNISMTHIANILKKTYHPKMSEAEIDAFKIAAVIFVMTNVLATGGNSKDIPLGLLKYLIHPSEIHLFNWGLLVRRYLVSWSHFVNQQLRMHETTITIGGCFLLPMVAYLDNLVLGPVTMLHYEFPRAIAYDQHRMMLMIAADTTISSEPTNSRKFGISELKKADKVFYGRWLVDSNNVKCHGEQKRKQGNLENAEHIKKKQIKGMVAKLVLLAANKCMKREILKAIGLGKMDICSCTVPEKSTIPEEVISKMDAYIEASKHPQRHNWKMFRQFYDALKKGVVLQQQKCWVHHLKPYEIKISGRSLATQLLEGGRYSSTVCDAILRDQIQCEDKAFSETEKRQRHLMPASFLHSYRERRCISNVEQLRVFFYGDHVKYKVSECIQINMPVPIRRKWSCYSWNLIDRTLTVLDPVLMKGDISIIKQTHKEIVSELRTAMISCLDAFYPDYTTKASDWKIIYRNDISEKCKWCDSGLYSLHYALNFNTDALTEEINWEDDFIGRWRSVWNIISMEGNIGVKPERFLEIENDEESE